MAALERQAVVGAACGSASTVVERPLGLAPGTRLAAPRGASLLPVAATCGLALALATVPGTCG